MFIFLRLNFNISKLVYYQLFSEVEVDSTLFISSKLTNWKAGVIWEKAVQNVNDKVLFEVKPI